MSTTVSFNGVSYTVPALADASWGTNVSNYLIAIATGCLQKSGGTFTLTAEVNFGATYGIKVARVKSQTANIAAAGYLWLAKTDTINWRNNANGADLPLGIDSSDRLTFNSLPITALAFGAANTVLRMNSAGTATEYAKLVAANIDAAAAIADTQLATIATAGKVSNSATTAASANTASAIVARDGSGNFTAGTITAALAGNATTATTATTAGNVSGVVAIANGGSGQATAALARTAFGLAIGTDVQAYSAKLGFFSGLADGSAGQLLKTLGSSTGYAWVSAFSNPMTTTGDIVYSSDGSGTPARLAIGASGTVLKGGTTPSWATIVNADVDAAAAIAGTKIVSASGSTSGVVTGSAQSFNGAKTFADTTDTTSGATGAIITPGGIGCAKNIFSGALITSTTGVKVKNTGAGSTTLSWYEESTWTPVATYATGSASATTVNDAKFTRVGRMVHLTMDISWDKSTGSGALTVTGLPYASGGTFHPCAIGYLEKVTIAASNAIYAAVSASTINFYTKATGSASSMSTASATEFASSAMRVMLTCQYYV